MSIGLYKPGQGYWMRVLTAAGVGVMFMFGAVWGWGQAQAVRLPAKHWTFSTSAGRGEPAVGDTVVMLRYKGSDTTPSVFGSGVVESYQPANNGRGELVVHEFDNATTRDEASDTERVLVGDADNPSFRADVTGSVSEPIFPQLYLQAGVAGGLVLIGTIATAWFVGSNPASSDFLIATDSEMKKVNWSTAKQIRGSTIVVIVAAFLIAGLLFLVDIGFSTFFRFIDVLQTG